MKIGALFVGPITGQWAQFPATNEAARFSTQIKLQLLHVTLNHFHSLILIKLYIKKKLVMRAMFRVLHFTQNKFSAQGSRQSQSYLFQYKIIKTFIRNIIFLTKLI